MGRIEYVKFTSVIFDNYLYLFNLFTTKNPTVKTKTRTIKQQKWSVEVFFQAFHYICLNFVLKTQIQYFLESECDNNIWSDKNIHRYGSILTLFIWNLFKPIGSKFTVDPVISFVLNSISFDPDVRRPWAGMCNFSHTHNKRTLKTHITQNKLAHMVWANKTPYLSLVSKTGSLSNFHHPY